MREEAENKNTDDGTQEVIARNVYGGFEGMLSRPETEEEER
jgi:hypothetical protein